MSSAAQQLPLFTRGDADVEQTDSPLVSQIEQRGQLAIELRRGTSRRRRIEGVLNGTTLVVTYPPRMSKADVLPIAFELRDRMQRRLAREHVDLEARARKLAKLYGLPNPRSVVWSDRQQGRWGSCTPTDGTIRIASRLAEFPLWVLDYVLVHELAHLVHGDHSARFHKLVAQYPKTERAIGFLIAKSCDDTCEQIAEGSGEGTAGVPSASTL